MKHFVAYPSADPVRAQRCAALWKTAGYEVVIGLDPGKAPLVTNMGHRLMTMPSPYPGYYKVANSIATEAFASGADLVTMIGDDMEPPGQGAAEIAQMYFNRFPDGFGVLQGCGDPQGVENGVPAAARICGSPTFGRGWFERAYGGRGPFCDQYGPFYGDEDLWNVAKLCGVLWLEPTVKIFHKHWSWGHTPRQPYHEKAQTHWEKDKETFFRRKEQGFPGWVPAGKGEMKMRELPYWVQVAR